MVQTIRVFIMAGADLKRQNMAIKIVMLIAEKPTGVYAKIAKTLLANNNIETVDLIDFLKEIYDQTKTNRIDRMYEVFGKELIGLIDIYFELEDKK
jgi:hypothetical protein